MSMSDDSSLLDKIQGQMRSRFGMKDQDACCDFQIEERPATDDESNPEQSETETE